MSKEKYSSETSKHRAILVPYCQGYGIDVGFGGDPITPNAIRVDLETPYAYTGEYGVQLGGDCRNLLWFADGVLDFVYSSHVLEDFESEQTGPIMKEWARVLKEGGHLVLLQPDQQRFLKHCAKTGQPVNPHHAVDQFSLEYIVQTAEALNELKLVASQDGIDEYSFYVVFAKIATNTRPAGEAGKEQEEIGRLRRELARVESNYQQTRESLERYRAHPVVQILKKPYLYLKRLTSRAGPGKTPLGRS